MFSHVCSRFFAENEKKTQLIFINLLNVSILFKSYEQLFRKYDYIKRIPC